MANLLAIGKSGLEVAKKSIETTSHNIANVNTEGFSRRRVVQQTNAPSIKGGVVMGTGVNIKDIERSHAPYVKERLNSATTTHNFFKERTEQLGQIENIFNELEVDGLNIILNKFYNSFRELANNPEDETMRSIVRDNASLVVKDFKRIRTALDNLSYATDARLVSEINVINSLLENISETSIKILQVEATGSMAGDLRDQRDILMRQLSEYFKIRTYESKKDGLHVIAQGIGTLIAGKQVQKFTTASNSKDSSGNNLDGSREIYFQARSKAPISEKFVTGRLGAMLMVRNKDQRVLRENIDNIAFELVNSVNAFHKRGFVGRKVPLGEDGRILEEDSIGPTTGINFFTELSSREGASLDLDLSESVKESLSNIVTALDPNAPGDNRVALAISNLQDQKIMDKGSATVEEYYLKQIGRVGLETKKSNVNASQAEGILALTNNVNERISGVNLDEEAANLVKFQHAYEASARVMSMAEEMFKTVLGLKR